MVSTPSYPDPAKTAAAQAGLNQDTAITQQLVNQTNQVTPTGSLTYSPNGTSSFVDSKGKTVTVPQYTATTSLSPEEQAIFDKTQSARQNLANIASDQSGFLEDYLGKPVDLNTATEDKIDELGRKRLDPQFAQEEDQLRSQLFARGIREGTPAFDAAMANFGQNKNDAYNSLYLSGRQQGAQEALAERNQPINEISALLSGSQVQSPQFVSTPQSSVNPVDYTGMVNSKYQADSQNAANTMGGLFGLLSAPFQMFSF